MYGLDSVNIVWLPRMGWSFPRVLFCSELATVVWINLYGIRLCTVFLLVWQAAGCTWFQDNQKRSTERIAYSTVDCRWPAGHVRGPAGHVSGPAGHVSGPAGHVKGPAGHVKGLKKTGRTSDDRLAGRRCSTVAAEEKREKKVTKDNQVDSLSQKSISISFDGEKNRKIVGQKTKNWKASNDMYPNVKNTIIFILRWLLSKMW